MECTPVSSASARAIAVTPGSLFAALTQVKDPRCPSHVRYPLASLVALALTAILSGQRSVLAMAEWAARQQTTVLDPLGFPPGRAPHQSTLQRLFAKLDATSLSAELQASFTEAAAPDPAERGSQGVAIDGKAQRGRLPFQERGAVVHALTAFCHDTHLVLAQEPITPGHGSEKGEAGLTVAPALLGRVDWRERVLTADALLCQRKLCQQVLDAGGDYLLIVKENQPTLLEDLTLLFDSPFPGVPLTDRREARSLDHGHGRQREVRHLIASTDLTPMADWPGLAQVFRWERIWQEHGRTKHAVRYGITSLVPAVASAQRLLALKRGHWGIENRLHFVKDETLGEDRSTVHQAHGPAVLATLRDTALNLLRLSHCRAIASRLRALADSPTDAPALVTGPISLHA